MAKNMARLDNNKMIVNVEWVNDNTLETDILVNINDYSVEIGDTYKNGFFYRNGERILTPLEELSIKYYELNASYQEGVNSV